MSKGKFIKLDKCPKCREQGKDRHGDNLAVYSDGSYCFSCGYVSRSFSSGCSRHEAKIQITDSKPVFGSKFESRETREGHPSFEALEWIDSLDLTDKEKYGILHLHWNSHYPGWQFPVNKNFYQVRNFAPKRRVKWISHGQKPLLHLYNQTTGPTLNSVVLVEDIISAVKVSRVVTASPLFGSNWKWTADFLQKLTAFDTVIIWLDYDKKDYAFKMMKKAQQYGINCKLITTREDPKELSTEVVGQLINALT